MRLRLLVLTVAAAAAACAHERPARAPASDAEFQYRGYAATFPTGLRLVVVQTAELGRSTVTVSYATGEADDPPGKEGLARLAATLTRDAIPRGGVSLGERAFAAGALTSTLVRSDEVIFRTVTRQAQLGEVVTIEAERLRDPLAGIDAERFLSVRAAVARDVAEEAAREGGTTLQRRTVLRRALAGTRYGGPPPTPESVLALTEADVSAWAAEHLAPERAVVVVTGPEAPQAVAQGVIAVFGELATTGHPGEPRIAPVARPAAIARAAAPDAPETLRLPGASPRIWLAWKIPGDAARATVSARTARRVLEARLRAALGDPAIRDRVVDLQVELEPGLDASALLAWVDLEEDGDAGKVRDALLRAAGASTALEWLDPIDVPRDEGFWGLERGIGSDAPRIVRATGQVDPLAELRTQARELGDAFRPFYEANVRPEAARTLAVGRRADVAEEPATPEPPVQLVSRLSDLEAASPGPDRVRALVEPPGIAGAVRRRLPNGLEVVVVPRGTLPVVEARLLVDAEPVDGPAAALTPAAALMFSRKEWSVTGTFGCAASPISALGEKLAFWDRGSPGLLPIMLDRISCWTKRTVDASLLEDAVKMLREAASRDTAEVRAYKALVRASYADPRRALPELADAAKLTVGDAQRWLERELRPERALLLVVGKVLPNDALFADIEARFGRWRPGAPERAARPDGWPAARRVILVDAPGAEGAVVGLAVRAPAPARGDDAAARVLRHLLFQRLHRELTPLEARAGTVWAGWRDAPVLAAWIRADRARAVEALRRTIAVVERLPAAPPGASETTLARWLAAQQEAYRFDTVSGTAGALQAAFFERRPLESWDALPASLAAVDPARVHAAAKALGIGHEGITVLGDAAKLEPELRAAGLAVEVVKEPGARRAGK